MRRCGTCPSPTKSAASATRVLRQAQDEEQRGLHLQMQVRFYLILSLSKDARRRCTSPSKLSACLRRPALLDDGAHRHQRKAFAGERIEPARQLRQRPVMWLSDGDRAAVAPRGRFEHGEALADRGRVALVVEEDVTRRV